MLFDRRPFYLIGSAAGLVFAAILYFAVPKITPERRVHEQLALLAREPWTHVRIDGVQYLGSGAPDQAIVSGVRLDTNAPVRIEFIAKSPYTSPSAMKRLTERALEGQVADILMLPRSITFEPYRSQFQPVATHAGVAVFAGFPQAPTSTVTPPAGDMSVETPPALPAPAAPSAPAAVPATSAPTHG